jgi:membrane protease YdiL (CAAX protease family)
MKPILTYFALAYALSWIIWLPLYGPALGLHGLPVLPFHHGIGGLGPLIAAFLTTWIWEGPEALRRLFRQSLQIRPLAYLLIALLSPFVLAILAAVGAHFSTDAPLDLSGMLVTRDFPEMNLFSFFLYNLIFFGWGEEVGWRGFALPRFQQHMNALSASLSLTVLWAIWHWPLFLYRPGYTHMDVAGALGWVFSLLTGSILLSWLYNSSRGSVLVCAVFHSTIDIAFTADFASKEVVNYMGATITIWGILTILIFRPRHLARIPRTTVHETEVR